MVLFHKRHFYCAMKPNRRFQKFQLFQLKLGIHSCVICPLIGCICLLLSGNVYPFFIEIIEIIEILRVAKPLVFLLYCSYAALMLLLFEMGFGRDLHRNYKGLVTKVSLRREISRV